MKLITNFRDYYDSVAAQDRDTSTMWTRNKFDKCEYPHEQAGFDLKTSFRRGKSK